MSDLQQHPTWRTRADLRAANGVLLVLREPPPAPAPTPGQPPAVPANPAEGPEVLLAIADDGAVLALAGHVDLGTGLRTAYAQIVADELDVPLARVQVILGHTAMVPNQGPTIASTSIQIHAQPLRQAAAQARGWLLQQAATAWQVPAGSLHLRDGVIGDGVIGEGVTSDSAFGHGVFGDGAGRQMAIGALLAGQHVELMLDALVPLKPAAVHRLIGQSVPRIDLPAKALGEAVFVHDLRLPGMLHGRVVRPPYAGVDAGDFVGRSLAAVHRESIAPLPGIVQLVVQGDFIGIVAQREEQAEAAMRALRVDWQPWTPLPPLHDLAQAISANPSTPRVVAAQGDVDAARGGAAQVLDRSYVWPYQMHASIGPSCAVAQWHGDAPTGPVLSVWAGTQNPHVLRADLARLMGLPDTAIEVVRLEAAGCYGRNSADDVAADAALLARAVAPPAAGGDAGRGAGPPVRVQLTREQEHAWEPKGAAQLMQVRGGLNADGSPAAYDFQTSYPSNGAPTLALLLTGTVPAVRQAFEMGDRTAVPPYAYRHQRITVNDMAPILRASWLRGVSALPNSFAHESYIDELASAAGVDPVQYRLRHLDDARAAELVRATAAKAGWVPHSQPQQLAGGGADDLGPDWRRGQGFAYARYVHSKFPGFGAAWAAWVADVAVNRRTGDVHVSRIVVGQDAGLMINPAGVRQQVHGNVLQTTSRALKERVPLDPVSGAVASREWGSYPILNFRDVPVVDVLLMPRPGEPPLGVGESASVPGTAAIANAIFDATGVRLRQPPFTPEVVRAALAAQAVAGLDEQPTKSAHGAAASAAPVSSSLSTPATEIGAPQPPARAAAPQHRRRRPLAMALALVGGLAGLAAAALGWRPAIAPVQATQAGIYSAATLEKGRQLAALGNCAVCHTAPGGAANAGGRAMETPFGRLYSTNLTPDAETGIGRWSFSAFQRAMREGVSRDGRHLYPAFPFTAFAQVSDGDLMALYAHLMVQPAVRAEAPPNALRFPFNWRPLMGLWNALHLTATPAPASAAPVPAADATRGALWQRGAYLVNGIGHCGACHTPRDALGAERSASAYLGGALVQGWEAPALGRLARTPVPWTEAMLVQYLRQGHSATQGIAGGPMAAVVRGLASVDLGDVQAIAHYLVSLQVSLQGPLSPASLQAPLPGGDAGSASGRADALLAAAANQAATLRGPAQRLFEGACGACHHDGNGPQVLGLNLPLALNGNLHSARPDNLLRTILDGIPDPAFAASGHMPAFRDALDDAQIADLAAHMRQRFAPDQPAWNDLPAAVARLRAQR